VFAFGHIFSSRYLHSEQRTCISNKEGICVGACIPCLIKVDKGTRVSFVSFEKFLASFLHKSGMFACVHAALIVYQVHGSNRILKVWLQILQLSHVAAHNILLLAISNLLSFDSILASDYHSMLCNAVSL
jgi:hypothetical protein